MKSKNIWKIQISAIAWLVTATNHTIALPQMNLQLSSPYPYRPPYAFHHPAHSTTPQSNILIFPGLRPHLESLTPMIDALTHAGHSVSVAVPRSQLEGYKDEPDYTISDVSKLVETEAHNARSSTNKDITVVAHSISVALIEKAVDVYPEQADKNRFVYVNPVLQSLASEYQRKSKSTSLDDLKVEIKVPLKRRDEVFQIKIPHNFYNYYNDVLKDVHGQAPGTSLDVSREVVITQNDELFGGKDEVIGSKKSRHDKAVAHFLGQTVKGQRTRILIRKSEKLPAHNPLRAADALVLSIIRGDFDWSGLTNPPQAGCHKAIAALNPQTLRSYGHVREIYKGQHNFLPK